MPWLYANLTFGLRELNVGIGFMANVWLIHSQNLSWQGTVNLLALTVFVALTWPDFYARIMAEPYADYTIDGPPKDIGINPVEVSEREFLQSGQVSGAVSEDNSKS